MRVLRMRMFLSNDGAASTERLGSGEVASVADSATLACSASRTTQAPEVRRTLETIPLSP